AVTLAKICGINSPAAAVAAAAGGAAHIGLVFYPPSPRSVSAETAAQLASLVPERVGRVGLFVDPTDDELQSVLSRVPLTMLQLHGRESPERIEAIKRRFGLKLMKAIGIAAPEDLDAAAPYLGVADWLLFDAKPPKEPGALPGGNARPFDWRILAGRSWPLPWMLSGGLTAGTLGEAVRITGAPVVDVSSGVEDRPGVKNPDRIRAFLEAAARL
ncbi:MAG: phosphoribosylanthranilate isomerase, partial [Rhodospirillales bacterium]|nr:phosphoribosylanthranilate isomerase [Rhodospirillales bacterium]